MTTARGHRAQALPLTGPRPTVSVVVAAADAALDPAVLRSVLSQEGVELDVVLVTAHEEAVRPLVAGDARVRVAAPPPGAGEIEARNAGLALVRGGSVMVLPATDRLTDGALERAAALLEAHPWVGGVYGAGDVSDRTETTVPSRIDWTLWSGSDWIERTSRYGSDLLVDHAVLVRRDVADAIGGYAVDLPRTADLDYWLRLASISGIGRINGIVQTRCRPAPAADPLTELRERHRTIEQFFEGFGHDSSGRTLAAGDRRDRASRALAQEAMRRALLHRASADLAERAEGARFASIAAECWPEVVATPEWRRYLRRGEHSTSPSRRALELGADRVRAVIPWRRTLS